MGLALWRGVRWTSCGMPSGSRQGLEYTRTAPRLQGVRVLQRLTLQQVGRPAMNELSFWRCMDTGRGTWRVEREVVAVHIGNGRACRDEAVLVHEERFPAAQYGAAPTGCGRFFVWVLFVG